MTRESLHTGRRRVAAVVAAAAAFGVLTVGCGEDDPVLESPGTEDAGGDQPTDDGAEGEDDGLY